MREGEDRLQNWIVKTMLFSFALFLSMSFFFLTFFTLGFLSFHSSLSLSLLFLLSFLYFSSLLYSNPVSVLLRALYPLAMENNFLLILPGRQNVDLDFPPSSFCKKQQWVIESLSFLAGHFWLAKNGLPNPLMFLSLHSLWSYGPEIGTLHREGDTILLYMSVGRP